jgi:acetyl esterase/lipase
MRGERSPKSRSGSASSVPSYLLAAHGLGTAGAVLAALRPSLAARASPIGFPASLVASQAPVHELIWAGGVGASLVKRGGLNGAPGRIGLAAVAAAVPGLARFARASLDATELFDSELVRSLGLEPERRGRTTAEWAALARLLPLRPRDVELQRDIDYVGDATKAHRLDLYRRLAPGQGLAPVLCYFHGGAWVMGSKANQSLPLLHHLARSGVICVSANYRLSPSATWPDHLTDVKRAISWTRRNIRDYGGDPDRIVVAGGSAGGHLATLAALSANDPQMQPGFEDESTSVAGCVSLYGVYDFLDQAGEMPGLTPLLEAKIMKVARRAAPERYRQASPIEWLTSQRPSTGPIPPFFTAYGSSDSIVPPSTARRFIATLRSVSTAAVVAVELPDTEHAFDLFWSPRTLAMVEAVRRFVEVVTAPVPIEGPGHPRS